MPVARHSFFFNKSKCAASHPGMGSGHKNVIGQATRIREKQYDTDTVLMCLASKASDRNRLRARPRWGRSAGLAEQARYHHGSQPKRNTSHHQRFHDRRGTSESCVTVVHQQRIGIILSRRPRGRARSHAAQRCRDLEDRVGIADTFGPDVGDAVCGWRRWCPGRAARSDTRPC